MAKKPAIPALNSPVRPQCTLRPSADDRVDAAHGQQRDQVHHQAESGLAHQNTLPLNRPDGRQISIATISAKATAVL